MFTPSPQMRPLGGRPRPDVVQTGAAHRFEYFATRKRLLLLSVLKVATVLHFRDNSPEKTSVMHAEEVYPVSRAPYAAVRRRVATMLLVGLVVLASTGNFRRAEASDGDMTEQETCNMYNDDVDGDFWCVMTSLRPRTAPQSTTRG